MSTQLRRFYVHVHIFKCGGTSFGRIMQDNFRNVLITSRDHMLDANQLNAKQVENAILRHPHARAMTGHRQSLDLPFDAPGLDLRAFVFIRDPVAHLISWYEYSKSLEKSLTFADTDGKTLSEWIHDVCHRTSVSEYGNMYTLHDPQLRFLTGLPGEAGLEKVRDIMKRHSEKVFLFPLRRMREALSVIHGLFPEDFRIIRDIKINRTKKTEALSQEDEELIRRTMTGDMELCRMADEFFAQSFDEAARHHPLPSVPKSFYVGAGLRRVSSLIGQLANKFS